MENDVSSHRASLKGKEYKRNKTARSYISNDFELDVFGIRVAWAGFGFLLLIRKVRLIRLDVQSNIQMLCCIYTARCYC